MDARRSTGIRELIEGIAERALRTWQELSGSTYSPAPAIPDRLALDAGSGSQVGHAA
ncbi:MAG: hypothetical protein ACKO2C_00885 [Actinomycetes bacterium]